jgi:hypothetical protein
MANRRDVLYDTIGGLSSSAEGRHQRRAAKIFA